MGHKQIFCTGTTPGKPRANLLSALVLIVVNCTTVQEVLDYLNNSYDWFFLCFEGRPYGGNLELWNHAFVIGGAAANHGLIELGFNGFYYTPYTNGQGSYYINPLLAEYSPRAKPAYDYSMRETLLVELHE